jgi:hypothetical protein
MRIAPSGFGRARAGAFAVAVVVLSFVGMGEGRAEQITGLVSGPGVANGLVFFDSASPGTVSAPLAVTGLQSGESLIGIDYRPTTGVLYAVGNLNRLYIINTTTGAATGVPLTPAAGSGFTSLSGSFFGIDFNPVPDLAGMASLRVISNADQNLRINANPGSLGEVNLDTSITPTNLNIVGSAYSNNDIDPATGTTLFGIDSLGNALVRATNANAGTYVTVDPLGADPAEFVGFDISGLTATAYLGALLDGGTNSVLWTVDYLSPDGTNPNRATPVGTIGLANGFVLNGLAAPAFIPEPPSLSLLALGLTGLGLFIRRRKRKSA